MIISSSPVGANVCPFTQPTLFDTHENTCLPALLTNRNCGPQKVPSGCPTMMRCDTRPLWPCPYTPPVGMNCEPPRSTTVFRSTVKTRPDATAFEPDS